VEKLTKSHGRRYPSPINNPTSRNNRRHIFTLTKLSPQHINHLRNQRNNPGPTGSKLMPAGVSALDDQHVGAAINGLARRRHRPDLPEHHKPFPLQRSNHIRQNA
jgi:hypothetical protein